MSPADERRKLVGQLVRAQGMLWTAEDNVTKLRLRKFILNIEQRLAALDGPPRLSAPSGFDTRPVKRPS